MYYSQKYRTFAVVNIETARRTMDNKIKHEGIIDTIEGNHVQVRIHQATACSSCRIAGHCNASEMKEKIVDVYTDSSSYRKGEKIIVFVSKKATNKALVLGFAVPFLFMLITLIATYCFTQNEAVSAISSVGVLIPYYILLWLNRDKIAQQISFHIEKSNV